LLVLTLKYFIDQKSDPLEMQSYHNENYDNFDKV